MEKKELSNFSDDSSFLKFSKKELFLAALETIKSLNFDEKYFICPFLTPSGLLCTESAGKDYFLLSELYLMVDSKEKEIEIELNNQSIKEWLVPEFIKNKAKLTISSNISCLGNIFYKIAIAFNKDPKNQIKINDDPLIKELIENCVKTNIKERWSLEKIDEFVNEKDFEEKEEEEEEEKEQNIEKEELKEKDNENQNINLKEIKEFEKNNYNLNEINNMEGNNSNDTGFNKNNEGSIKLNNKKVSNYNAKFGKEKNDFQEEIEINNEKIEKLNEELEKTEENLKKEKDNGEKRKKGEQNERKENEEKEKQEREKNEKEKKEKEIERKKNEELEKKRKEYVNLQKEKKRQEREKELKEKKKREEEERKKREQIHIKNYPDGISSLFENIENKEIKFIHLEIKFLKEEKDIEIFDIFGPSKQGYRFVKMESNKYYVVFPFYKFSNLKSIIIGIRDIVKKESIDNKTISGEHLRFDNQLNQWELNLLKKDNYETIFNIYNVPIEINKINYLKFLDKLKLKNYKFTLDCIREITSTLNYQEILDLIMETGGINELSELLIKIIIDRKIDIYHISHYLESHKNNKFKNNFYEMAPNIIYLVYSKDTQNEEKKEINHIEEINYEQRKYLLCLDPNIPINLYPNNYQKDLVKKSVENLGKSSLEETKNLEIKRKEITNKLSEFNKNQKINGLEEITCILTDTTVKKLSQLEYGILANIPIIIQGFTSAGKSFLSTVASKINKRECLSTALSEHTTTEDLLGRDVIKNDSSIKFIPGILLLAYKEGKTLILDECDLAKPEILSCILGSLTKNELIICNQTFRKMDGYNVILTMNGEVKGFNEKQRNILTSNILSKFILIPFDEMEKEECQEIFKNLLDKYGSNKDYIKNINVFIELHQKLIDDMKDKEEMKNNIKSIDPIVTLRNLKYCCYLSRNKIHPRISAEISYIARFPKNERKSFENLLNKLGNIEKNKELTAEIEKSIKDNFLFYNETYKQAIYLALTALKEGLHPLLIGEKGCGLTTVAKLVASISSNNNYEFLLCSSETSVEDLIGCYQPQIRNKNRMQDLSSYIKWHDGPVPRAGKKGVPIILDNINYSKAQVIECLNPLLEENSKYNKVEYNILEKESEGPIQMNKGFSIIGTMVINKENKNSISKALMNRFVAIYIDNDIKIDDKNLKIIIENTGKKIDKQIKEANNIFNKNKNEDDKYESLSDSDSNNESNEIEDNENIIKNEDKKNENRDIPEWFNIKGISGNTIKEIQNYFKKEKIREKSLKKLIKKISKLFLVYERIHTYGFTMEDCDDFIDLKFKKSNDIYIKLQKLMLLDSQILF